MGIDRCAFKYIIPILCQLLLQAQQAFFIPGLHQFMNQGGGREEADGEPLLAGRQTETEGDMGLSDAARAEAGVADLCVAFEKRDYR